MNEKDLLLHWWHHYGKCIYTLDELEKFKRIIAEYGTDRVIDAFFASLVCSDGSPTLLLMYIRANKIEEFFRELPSLSDSKSAEEKEEAANIKKTLLELLANTYGK